MRLYTDILFQVLIKRLQPDLVCSPISSPSTLTWCLCTAIQSLKQSLPRSSERSPEFSKDPEFGSGLNWFEELKRRVPTGR